MVWMHTCLVGDARVRLCGPTYIDAVLAHSISMNVAGSASRGRRMSLTISDQEPIGSRHMQGTLSPIRRNS